MLLLFNGKYIDKELYAAIACSANEEQDVPEHPLPCGHVLCTACIKAYGKQKKTSIIVSCCPLHRESTMWAKPVLIRFKPIGAGVRVLSLDGGGIRGIVQLEVLRAIEHVLGCHISVPTFFDLMVGTGTGGLIATALSMKHHTVESCIDMFTALCDHAYTRRGVPILGQLAQFLGSGPKYKTKPLHAALKTAFTGEDSYFGSHEKFRARVGVTSTSATGQDTILIASYRRADDPKPAYSFERPHDPDLELRTYEAIAASLSSPAYFRPFVFHNKTYLDGGMRCPNPAAVADRERTLIWPDTAQPDMFLSLGTGQNRITVLQKLSDRPASTTTMPTGESQSSKKSSTRWRGRRADDIVDAELAWADFRTQAVRNTTEAKGRRFIRFNPDLDREPPSADNKSEMISLQSNVRKRLQTAHRQAALRNVAHRLVASSFYLELQSKATAEKSEQVCIAAITCRFEDGSKEMSALGRILKDHRADDFEPHFLVKPDHAQRDLSFKVTISPDVIGGMINNGVFGLPNVYIPLRNEDMATSIVLFLSKHDGLEPDGFPISGFPRVLLGEPSGQVPKRKPRRPVRASTDNPRRNVQSADGDSLSLNGSLWPGTRNSTSDTSSLHDPQPQPSQMSLAELIDQHQNVASSVKQRTNRFWTYIGNNHMAHNPDQYTEDELARYAAHASAAPEQLSFEMPRRTSSRMAFAPMPSAPQSRHALPQGSPGFNELDTANRTPEEAEHREPRSQARDSSYTELSQQQTPTLPRHSSNSTRASTRSDSQATTRSESQSATSGSRSRPNTESSLRTTIPSMCQTELEEDDDWVSTYSGEDVQFGEAQSAPLVQVRPRHARNTIDSIMSLYNNGEHSIC